MPKRIILHFTETFPSRVLEWILAFILFSWGLMLLRPDATFASSPSYIGLERIASEDTWGWFCAIAGLLRLVALCINGFWKPTYHIRAATSFLSNFFWLQITLGFIASGNANTGLAVYPWLLLADIICTYRTARDYSISRAAEG